MTAAMLKITRMIIPAPVRMAAVFKAGAVPVAEAPEAVVPTSVAKRAAVQVSAVPLLRVAWGRKKR